MSRIRVRKPIQPETWECYARPAAIGRRCGYLNTVGTAVARSGMAAGMEHCAGCGCTLLASDHRRDKGQLK